MALGKTQMLLVLGLALIPRRGGHWGRAMGGDHYPGCRALPLVSTGAGARLSGGAGLRRGTPVFAGPVAGVALGYAVVTLLAVVLSVPYWHFLGLL